MTDPTKPIDIFIRLLIVLLGMLFMGQSSSAPIPPVPPAGTFISPTIIGTVEAQILESNPAQIQLVISGQQPDGCEFPVIVAQSRSDNTVNVQIYREVPVDVMCAMVLLPYNETITLDGTFESGTYTITVNDFTLDVTV